MFSHGGICTSTYSHVVHEQVGNCLFMDCQAVKSLMSAGGCLRLLTSYLSASPVVYIASRFTRIRH
jgi:hypothetical protein